MALRKSAIAIILLATFTVPECARITPSTVRENVDAEASEGETSTAADSVELQSANSPHRALESAFVEETDSRVAGSSPAFHVAPDAASRDFYQTLDYVKRASGWHRRIILMAACESSAFSCEEIIHLVDFSGWELWEDWGVGDSRRWVIFSRLFADGRERKGCISDLGNAQLIIDAFDSRWRETEWSSGSAEFSFAVQLLELQQAFLDSEALEPATNMRRPHMQLQTGFRTDEDMKELMAEMKEVLLAKFSGYYGSGNCIVSKFVSWLKRIRSNGEQFSGPQLVTFVNAIPEYICVEVGTTQAVSLLLRHLEQYIGVVTCEEVNQILHRMIKPHGESDFFYGLDALKPSIVDGHNKVSIVAATSFLTMYEYTDAAVIEASLRDVGAGLPPKNNPIFGIVDGNPIILVVDEATSMDAEFSIGNDTSTRRKFCHTQLETVLQALPDGTYFNVIRYSVYAVKVFPKPVLASKIHIDKVMEAVSWRGGYTPGQDPSEMLLDIKMFALEFKHQFHRSAKKNVLQALELAYGTAESRPTDDSQHLLFDRGALDETKDLLPQIYFLSSGEPDGGSSQILDRIDSLDSGRNIPVNSISWIMPAHPEAKQFVKDVACKTGGFFRPIEHQISI